MCLSIQRQLERQAQQPQQVVVQRQVVVTQQPTRAPAQQQQYQLVTEYQQVTRQVKHCNGRTCWYENVTEYVPVTRRVATPAKPAPPNLLTNDELVPTPQAAVDEMLLRLANLGLTSGSRLIDLGCGDGRILKSAVKDYGVSAVGVEINPKTVTAARASIQLDPATNAAWVFLGDVQTFDIGSAEFVTMYLYPDLMEVVVPRLPAGTKLASYLHDIPGVKTRSYLVEVNGALETIFIGTKL